MLDPPSSLSVWGEPYPVALADKGLRGATRPFTPLSGGVTTGWRLEFPSLSFALDLARTGTGRPSIMVAWSSFALVGRAKNHVGRCGRMLDFCFEDFVGRMLAP